MGSDLGIPGIDDAVTAGRRGLATVYRARQPAHQRAVTVKILDDTDDLHRTRWERECRAIGILSGHPNIVTLYESGRTRDGAPFLVTEHLRGGSLAERLERTGPVPWVEVLDIGVKLAGAVATAHRAGVLHRDLSPLSVELSAYGDPRLADFGIARLVDGRDTIGAISTSLDHAAPETIGLGEVTAASDQYSLAATLSTLIRGEPPFAGKPDADRADPPPSVVPFGAPPDLDAVLARALAEDPLARHRDVAAFGEALREVQRSVGLPPTTMVVEAPELPDETDEPEADEPVDVVERPALPSRVLPAGGTPWPYLPQRNRRRVRFFSALGALAAVAVVVVGVVALAAGDGAPAEGDTTPTVLAGGLTATTGAPTTTAADGSAVSPDEPARSPSELVDGVVRHPGLPAGLEPVAAPADGGVTTTVLCGRSVALEGERRVVSLARPDATVPRLFVTGVRADPAAAEAFVSATREAAASCTEWVDGGLANRFVPVPAAGAEGVDLVAVAFETDGLDLASWQLVARRGGSVILVGWTAPAPVDTGTVVALAEIGVAALG